MRYRDRDRHTVDRQLVNSFHHPVQPAAAQRREAKGGGRQKGAAVKAGKVRQRQGEGGEGRKEREGGRRLRHEEGRLTDIAALAISSHTQNDIGRLTHTHTQTDCALHGSCSFIILCGALSSILSSPQSERTRETQRERRKRRRREKGRGGGEGGEAVTLSSPLLRNTAER